MPINPRKSSHRPIGRFLDPLRIETDPRLPRSQRTWKLLERLRYVDSRGQEYWVPREFTTDGASIPWFFWRVVGHPMELDYVAAAVVHDFLWRQAVAGAVSYRKANWVFRDALRVLGLWRWRRLAMWGAVAVNAVRIQAFRRRGIKP